MRRELLDVMDSHYSDTVFDTTTYIKLKDFRLKWMQKSDDYIEFLSGVYMGVHPIRFSTLDEEMLLVDIFNIDIDRLQNELYTLKDINKNWNISSNVVYLSLIYFMHKFLHSKTIKKNLHNAIEECYYILAYKTTGSLISHYFKHNTTPQIAKTVYEELSNKYIIKQVNSWQEMFAYRAKVDVLPPKGNNVKRIDKLTTKDAVTVANDLQGKIRSVVKNIYRVMMTVNSNKSTITNTTLVEAGESAGIGSITESPTKYISKLHSIYKLNSDFIDDDIVNIVTHYATHTDAESLKDILNYISDKVDIKPNSKDDFIAMSIVTNINYLRSKGITSDYLAQLPNVVKYIKGYWSASSSRDPNIKRVKKLIGGIVTKSTTKTTHWVITNNILAVVMYLLLRALKR